MNNVFADVITFQSSNNVGASALVAILICLVATILIEGTTARLLKIRGKNLSYVVLAQIITNPIVVSVSLLCNVIALSLTPIVILVLEIAAVVFEGFFYKKMFRDYDKCNPFLASFCLNLLSFLCSLVVVFL